MTRAEKVARNRAIVCDYAEKRLTRAELAQAYSLTTSRISQIVTGAARRAKAKDQPLRPMTAAEARDLVVRRALLRRFDAEHGRSPCSLAEFSAWRVCNYDFELALERDVALQGAAKCGR